MKNDLIYPMAFYVFAMWALAVTMFLSRVRAIQENKAMYKYFRTFMGEGPSERVMVIGRHYDNQFQVPILFLITGTLHYSLGMVNLATVILAWIFVLSRAGHSWVHLGKNKLQDRVRFFALGWMAVLLLWIQLIYFVFQSS